VKITVLSHNLSSNAVMRAHRLAIAASSFAEVTLLGPVEPKGLWPALPPGRANRPGEPSIQTVPERRFPRFHTSMIELVDAADGDVLIACKPMLASYGAALLAAEKRSVPVILDLDDLDLAFTPREEWTKDPSLTDLRRPASAIYLSLLTKAAPAANAITVSNSELQRRFGGSLVHHGTMVDLFDRDKIDRDAARKEFGFDRPTVLFAGTPRWHKGIKPLARAARRVEGAQLAVFCRPADLPGPEWSEFPLLRLPLVPYSTMPRVMAAADVIAIPQLDTEAARCQMPIKVYDAMAIGTPIVATAVSDMPQVLERCAVLVPPGETKGLRRAIRRLITDPAEGRRLGERARQRCIKHYSMERVAQSLRQVVRSVLEVGEPSR
jgi:glycosyltransferase involved in cell wall biosynthesis